METAHRSKREAALREAAWDALKALRLSHLYVEQVANPEKNPNATTVDRACLQQIEVAISKMESVL